MVETIRSGRLSHAWLLSGPKGIGKATLAFRLARFLLADAEAGPGSLDMETTHLIFSRVASGGHADLRTVERTINPKTNKLRDEIVIDDVRGIGAFLRLTPAEGGWRVVVIDSADDMNRNAANAVLKILEEPPQRAILLLVSHAPGRLLATIRSRCRTLVLQPLSEPTVLALLADYCPDLDSDERAALETLSDGSVGRALDLAADGGVELYRDMLRVLNGLPKLDFGELNAFTDIIKDRRDGRGYETVAGLFQWWLARLIRTTGSGHVPAEVIKGEGALTDRLTRGHALERWLEVWEKSNHLFNRATSANLDRRQVIISAFLSLEDAVRS